MHKLTNTNGKLITYSSTCPYKNIATDEILIDTVKNDNIPILRIWENKSPCIYLGIGKKYKEEVFEKECKKDNIPVIRRFTGGGTVFQSKGNLNYTLVLPINKYPEFESIQNSYVLMFHIIKDIIASDNNDLIFNGTSDFCINNKKFSGNAQARRRKIFLHHGTILIDMNPNLISKYLQVPTEIPDYRKNRTHSEFITTLKHENIKISKTQIIKNFKNYFPKFTKYTLSKQEHETAKKLVKEKYISAKWINN